MTVKRRVVKPVPASEEGLVQTAADYMSAKSTVAQMEKRVKTLRQRLVDALLDGGTPDETGSKWLHIPKFKVKYERREGKTFNEDSAEEVLIEAGLLEECQATITVLDQEKVLSLYYEGRLSDDQLDEMYTTRETWALKVSEDR